LGEAVFILFMGHTKTLALARATDWDAIGQRIKDDILQALTGDEQDIPSENECEQFFHACRLLRMGRIAAITYPVIGGLLSLNKGLG
jgi:hypothetical protein